MPVPNSIPHTPPPHGDANVEPAAHKDALDARNDLNVARLTHRYHRLDCAQRGGGRMAATRRCVSRTCQAHAVVNGEVMAKKKRNYRKEYDRDHASPAARKQRSMRNKARLAKKLAVGDPREVDHKRPLARGGGNGKGNLRVVSRTTNRTRPKPTRRSKTK